MLAFRPVFKYILNEENTLKIKGKEEKLKGIRLKMRKCKW